MATSKIRSSANISGWKTTGDATIPANSKVWVTNFTKPVIVATTNSSCIPYVSDTGSTLQGYLYNVTAYETTAAIKYKEID